jgi:glycosyltransferase
MLISIITPTFNSDKTIGNCVTSIIKQTYLSFEHVIVDNLSTDGTVEIIRDIYQQNNLAEKVKIISEKDLGIADAFNKGIKAASGEIIGILNSDDYFYNNYVLERIAVAFANETVQLVHGKILMEDPVYGSNIRNPLLCNLTKAMPYNHPTMYFRRQVYEKYGLYDFDFKIVMDYEYLMRLHQQDSTILKGSIYLEGDPLVVMNFGGNSWKFEKESLKDTKKAFIKNDLWNANARLNLFLRRIRMNIRNTLVKLHLDIFVRWWRTWKWRN